VRVADVNWYFFADGIVSSAYLSLARPSTGLSREFSLEKKKLIVALDVAHRPRLVSSTILLVTIVTTQNLRMSYQAQWALSTASLASPNLTRLLEASHHEIDAAPLDYLFIELIHSLQQSSAVAHARRKRLNQEIQQAGLNLGSTSKQSSQNGVEETPEQQLALRLERVGIHVGSSLTERYVYQLPALGWTMSDIKSI
jgi:hypothetical protein